MPAQQSHQNERQQLRRELQQRRLALSEFDLETAGQRVSEHLLKLPEIKQANCIGGYFSVHNELATGPALSALLAQQKQLALPVLHPFCKGHLLFLRYHSNTKFVPNKYRIPEPELNCQQIVPLSQLQVLLVPLVGFDAHGNRMGMGGGFYDRTLSGWQQGRHPNLLPIGLAHDVQQVDKIPTAGWDVPLPMIITPAKIWHFSD